MNQTKRQARLASVPAPFGLIYVPNKLIVLNDPTATANQIRASESLLRFGIGCELLGSIIFIFVAVALYRLFKAVNETHALACGPFVARHFSFPFSAFSFLRGECPRVWP